MSLSEVQSEMCRQIYGQIHGVSTDSPGLAVYVDAYFSRLLGSLADDFPAVKRAMERIDGEQAFGRLVADYLKEFPSRFDGLQSLGYALPRFLEKHPASVSMPYIAELAELEWKVMECFYSDLASPRETCPISEADPDALATKPLVMAPSLRILRARWNIDQLWSETAGEPHECPRFLQIFRDGGKIQVLALEENEFEAMELAVRGKSLEEMSEALISSCSPEEIRHWMARWVIAGLLRGVTAEVKR